MTYVEANAPAVTVGYLGLFECSLGNLHVSPVRVQSSCAGEFTAGGFPAETPVIWCACGDAPPPP